MELSRWLAVLPLLLFGPSDQAHGEAFGPAQAKTFLTKHCVECHGPAKQKGNIALHRLSGDIQSAESLALWEHVLDMLDTQSMPPEDQPQPSPADRQAMTGWIALNLEARAKSSARQPLVRRLTNFEYQNTMRDLLGFELNLIDNLPVDPTKPYEFNNTAEFMQIGPELMDRYTANARKAMASAIVDPQVPEVHKSSKKWDPVGSPDRGMRLDEIGIYGNRRYSPHNGMKLKGFPTTGEYRIRVKAAGIFPAGYHEVPLRLMMGYGDLAQNQSMRQVEPVGHVILRNNVDDIQEFEFRGRIENHPVEPGIVTAKGQQPPTLSITPQNLFDDGRLNDHLDPLSVPRIVVQSIEFEAPVVDQWPPQYHLQILFDSPLREKDPDAYVHLVLQRFMSRAFRRPATPGEVDQFHKIYDILAAEFGTLEQAMRETLAMVLISPQFLYHTESDPSLANPQYAVASRLSYFLWGSMPDEHLMTMAAEGKLEDPQAIESEVRRMLSDPRSQDFVRNFTMQWLSIEKMKSIAINSQLFPRFLYLVDRGERAGTEIPYRPTIRDYMQDETVGFIAELIRRNASVLQIVDSDFAYINQPLAVLYGIDGVEGITFTPVRLNPAHRRGGLITHGAVLVGNSTGSAPHPIYRAVWLREAILGDEVKPPPAEVPALSETAGEAADNAANVKDLLALHRQNESCNDCHARLDPWGIAFERYSAIGQYQPKVPQEGTRVRGFDARIDTDLAAYHDYLKSINVVDVDATTQIPGGPEVDGMRELKDYLLAHRQEEIAENVIRRLLAYGIGRKLNYGDRVAVEQLRKQSEANDYRLADMILAICQSETFQGIGPGTK